MIWWPWKKPGFRAVVLQRFDDLEKLLRDIKSQGVKEMLTMQDIQNQAQKDLEAITAETDADKAIALALDARNQQIAALKQQLADAIANGASQEDLQKLQDTLTAIEGSVLSNTKIVVDAVNAGT